MNAPPLGSTPPEAADPLESRQAGRLAIGGGAVRAGAWLAGAGLSLVSVPLLARHLGVADFGRYVAVLAAVNIATLASDLGIGNLALREASVRDAAERPALLRSLLGLRIVVAAAGAAIVVAFAVASNWDGRMVAGSAIALIGLFAQVFGDFALITLAARLELRRVAVVEFARSALGTLAIVVLVVADAPLVAFFGAYAFAAVVGAALAVTLAGQDVPLVPRIERGGWSPLLADAGAYAAAAAVYVVYFRVVMVIVSTGASARQAGLFALPYRVVEFTAAVAGVLAGSATPLLARSAARGRGEEFRRYAVRTAVGCAGVGLVAAVVLFVLADPLVRLIGGASAAAAAPVMRILAVSVLTTFTAFGTGASLLVLRRYRPLLAINVASLVIVVTAALALVPAHGARGGALAVVLGELFMVAGQAIALSGALRTACHD